MSLKFSEMPLPNNKEPYYDYLTRLNEWVDEIPPQSRRDAYFELDYDTGYPIVVYRAKAEGK